MSQTDLLLEGLSELEHEQWLHWSRTTASQVSATMAAHWEASWVPYAELPEHGKELDRQWARRVLALLIERGLISRP